VTLTIADARRILAGIADPEIPVLTLDDLGIVRDVRIEQSVDESQVTVSITPTYSGCPAMDAIADEIQTRLSAGGFDAVKVETVYSPAWSTDWMSEAGKQKLTAYGIAPPAPTTETNPPVLCPQCSSAETSVVSEFGSTACKSLHVCSSCGEPFDLFKAI
jgi:ring-1,2-phenylacetyl-CoA epoxidase subunit PaaD